MLEASCGLLEGPLKAILAFDGVRYRSGPVSQRPRPDLAACFVIRGGIVIEWSHEPSIYLSAGGWAHTLYPTDTPGRWFGSASPLVLSEACRDQLAAAQMSFPVPLSVTIGVPTDP